MDKQKAIAIVVKLLPNYPRVTNWFITSDEQAFKDQKQAEAQAAFLKDNIVIAVTAEDALAAVKEASKEAKKGK